MIPTDGAIRFFVAGMPKPGGSKKAFFNPRANRIVVMDDCARNKDWRASVSQEAAKHFTHPLSGPLEVSFTFMLARPMGHYGTGRNAGSVRDSAPKWPETRPDVLKLSRSTEDALTGTAWLDDAQIVKETLEKRYGSPIGCWIEIEQEGRQSNA